MSEEKNEELEMLDEYDFSNAVIGKYAKHPFLAKWYTIILVTRNLALGAHARSFEWDHDNRQHGLTCIHKPMDVANTKITIADSGQFPRTALASLQHDR